MSVRAALCAFVRAPLPLRPGASAGGCLLGARLSPPVHAASASTAATPGPAAGPARARHVPKPPPDDSAPAAGDILAGATVAVAVADSPAPALAEAAPPKPAPETDPGLRWRCGAVCIPHPDKAEKGGEDAYFVVPNAVGVFDGVGGWASVGVDPGLYSKQLARLTAANVADGDVRAALEKATEDNKAIGSSTACVLALHDRALKSVNLGDSGFVIVRAGQLLARTSEQQHYFNCPFQLGTDSMDSVQMASALDLSLEHGDWLIVATDGLWDNVFPADILDVVNDHHTAAVDEERKRRRPAKLEAAAPVEKSGDEMDVDTPESASDSDMEQTKEQHDLSLADADPQALAQRLADLAQRVAMDERVASPFAVNAQEAGHLFLGGKMDDITVVAALVVDPALDGVEAPDQRLSNTTLEEQGS